MEVYLVVSSLSTWKFRAVLNGTCSKTTERTIKNLNKNKKGWIISTVPSSVGHILLKFSNYVTFHDASYFKRYISYE